MPEFDKEEYQFPDEIASKGVATSPEIEFEIEDDTPEEDRNREPMPKAIVDDLENDDLSKYDAATKEKLKQMRKVWHDERRAKESAYREQQEAVDLARRVVDENKRMKAILATGEKEYVASIQSTATLELEMAKRAYKDAYDNGDSDGLVNAQQSMQEATLKIDQAKRFKLPPLQEEDNNVKREQEQFRQPAAPVPDARAQSWRDNNDWFGADEEMTASALGLHEKLKRTGVVVGSDEYYSTLDKTMRKRFSEYFEDSEPEESSNKSAPTKLSTVVAPATRSTSSNKIKMTTRQVALAKKLGLTNEQYAIAMKKLEA